jgi:hypothetical protein
MANTTRYNQDGKELYYLKKLYAEGCEALGLRVEVSPVVNCVKSAQGEPYYERDKFYEGFCYVDDYYNRRKLGGNNRNEDVGGFPIILNVPVLFQIDPDYEINLNSEGHLVKIIDDIPSTIATAIDFGTLRVEKSQLSYDRTYWIISLFPYRCDSDSEVLPQKGNTSEGGTSLIRKWKVNQNG